MFLRPLLHKYILFMIRQKVRLLSRSDQGKERLHNLLKTLVAKHYSSNMMTRWSTIFIIIISFHDIPRSSTKTFSNEMILMHKIFLSRHHKTKHSLSEIFPTISLHPFSENSLRLRLPREQEEYFSSRKKQQRRSSTTLRRSHFFDG